MKPIDTVNPKSQHATYGDRSVSKIAKKKKKKKYALVCFLILKTVDHRLRRVVKCSGTSYVYNIVAGRLKQRKT